MQNRRKNPIIMLSAADCYDWDTDFDDWDDENLSDDEVSSVFDYHDETTSATHQPSITSSTLLGQIVDNALLQEEQKIGRKRNKKLNSISFAARNQDHGAFDKSCNEVTSTTGTEETEETNRNWATSFSQDLHSTFAADVQVKGNSTREVLGALDLAVHDDNAAEVSDTMIDRRLVDFCHLFLHRSQQGDDISYRETQIGGPRNNCRLGGSMVVKCTNIGGAIGITWNLNDTHYRRQTSNHIFGWELRVFPLVGEVCDWNVCEDIETKLMDKMVHHQLVLWGVSETNQDEMTLLSQCKCYVSLSMNILHSQKWIQNTIISSVKACTSDTFKVNSTTNTIGNTTTTEGWINAAMNKVSLLPNRQCYNPLDQVDSLVSTPPIQRYECEEAHENMNNKNNNRCCIVCFDNDTEVDLIVFEPCGHQICVECLRHYFVSDPSIRCPGHRCPIKLDLLDAAKCYFSNEGGAKNSGEDMSNNKEIKTLRLKWDKIIYLRRQHMVPCTLISSFDQAKFCSNSSCQHLTISTAGALLSSKPNEDGLFSDDSTRLLTQLFSKGLDMYLCSCGSTRCARCPAGSNSNRAHPGVSCEDYAVLQSALMKIGAEKESIRWVAQHTKPCPNCQRPIERRDGCNHMWCEVCRYYFCWMCGGPGHKCMAFRCSKQSDSVWANKIDTTKDSAKLGMAKEMQLLYKVKHYEGRMVQLDRTILNAASSCFTDEDQQVLQDTKKQRDIERQLVQVLLWCVTYDMHLIVTKRSMIEESNYSCARDRVELIVHVLKVKDRARRIALGAGAAASLGSGAGDTTMTAIQLIMNNGMNKKNNHLRKRHKKFVAERANKKQQDDVERFRESIAERALEELCEMSQDQLTHAATKAIEDVIGFLKLNFMTDVKIKSRQRPSRYGRNIESNGDASKYNRTIKPRYTGPWHDKTLCLTCTTTNT